MAEDKKDFEPSSDGSSMATKLVNALLDRHGVPARMRYSTLETALDLNYQQVRRRQLLSGWEIEELARLADFFGETLMDMVAGEAEVAPNALLMLGGATLPCVAAIGTTSQVGRKDALVAIEAPALKGGPKWLVVPPERAEGVSYEVRRVTFSPPKVALKRVAVFDEKAEDAESVAVDLRARGYEPQCFLTEPDFRKSLKVPASDAYVVGWNGALSGLSNLLDAIREVDDACPVVVITESLKGKLKAETELGALASRYRFLYYDKPAGLMRVHAALDFAFRSAGRMAVK